MPSVWWSSRALGLVVLVCHRSGGPHVQSVWWSSCALGLVVLVCPRSDGPHVPSVWWSSCALGLVVLMCPRSGGPHVPSVWWSSCAICVHLSWKHLNSDTVDPQDGQKHSLKTVTNVFGYDSEGPNTSRWLVGCQYTLQIYMLSIAKYQLFLETLYVVSSEELVVLDLFSSDVPHKSVTKPSSLEEQPLPPKKLGGHPAQITM